MIKKLIILVAVLAAVWAIPATRSRLVMAAQPALTKLGPFGERLLTPARRYSVRTELQDFLRRMRQDSTEGKRLPEVRGFGAWIEQRHDDSRLDPWGSAYWMTRKGRDVTVGSSGPDGRRGTEDDLSESAAF